MKKSISKQSSFLKNIKIKNEVLREADLTNIREAVANNRLEGLPINENLEAKLIDACERNESLDAEQLIDEFVGNN